MPRIQRDQQSFLSQEESDSFLVWAKSYKISKEKMAKIQGVAAPTVYRWFKNNTVLKAMKENVETRVELKELKEQLDALQKVLTK